MNKEIQENVQDLDHGYRKTKFKMTTIIRKLKQLFCDIRNSSNEYKLLVLFLKRINLVYQIQFIQTCSFILLFEIKLLQMDSIGYIFVFITAR